MSDDDFRYGYRRAVIDAIDRVRVEIGPSGIGRITDAIAALDVRHALAKPRVSDQRVRIRVSIAVEDEDGKIDRARELHVERIEPMNAIRLSHNVSAMASHIAEFVGHQLAEEFFRIAGLKVDK